MHSWLLLPLLGLVMTPQPTQKPKMGAAVSAPADDPLVLEARDFVQKHLAILRIERITEASTQVVAGRNVRLVCRVKEEDGEGTWEFIAWHRLGGHWRLQQAKRISD